MPTAVSLQCSGSCLPAACGQSFHAGESKTGNENLARREAVLSAAKLIQIATYYIASLCPRNNTICEEKLPRFLRSR